jgi:membrane protease YdiL (CAAX protease family)
MAGKTEEGGRAGRGFGAVVFGLVFPSVLTFGYFVALGGQPRALVQAFYAAGKLVQFGLPLAFTLATAGRLPRPSWPGWRGALAGLAFGLAVLVGALALHRGVLVPRGLYGAAAEAVRAKVTSFGLTTAARFAGAGVFYSVVHSAAEEYYWRWFVFGALRRVGGPALAIAGSSLGFMAHHVIILATFLGWASPWTYAGSAAVAVGGAYWAWLYQRSGSLLGPWLGHLLVDAAIFKVGFDLAGF